MNADAELFRDAIEYFPETGLFVWKISRHYKVAAGSVAGGLNGEGYWEIKFRGRSYKAHRVAWLIMTGEWPPQQIDHRNLDRGDNRWRNLRLATKSQNTANCKSRSKFGKGVDLQKNGRFRARLRKDGKEHHLGYFNTAEEAADAYRVAAIQAFGEFARVI